MVPEAVRDAAHRLTGAAEDYDPLMDLIGEKAGFYGLDLYSLHASMKAVLQYLEQVDPDAARQARARFACFDHFGPDPMFFGEVSSWNLRDSHMVETLESLVAHLGRQGRRAKVIVWAHNSHLGDARATAMGQRGELNVGQLVRQKYGREAVLVGFTTDHGTVTAASDWGSVAERKRVRPALAGSWEALFHASSPTRFLLTWHGDRGLSKALRELRLERAIGVVYRPETERASHYFHARLSDQFDAVLHFDETRAVEPLEYTAEWEAGELPETFPSRSDRWSDRCGGRAKSIRSGSRGTAGRGRCVLAGRQCMERLLQIRNGAQSVDGRPADLGALRLSARRDPRCRHLRRGSRPSMCGSEAKPELGGRRNTRAEAGQGGDHGVGVAVSLLVC